MIADMVIIDSIMHLPDERTIMQGYYRFPTIHKNVIAFVSEDDLWIVSVNGGIARRLTSNLSSVSEPRFSPDGKHIAFTGREEGHPEVYIMPAEGGTARRLTFLGAMTSVAGWTTDSTKVVFASNCGQWYRRMFFLYSNLLTNTRPVKLPFGAANQIAFGPGKAVVIGRNTYDPARWKRYRGGTVGELWIDRKGTGRFEKPLRIKGNLTSPMWVKNRIYFISDHEGVGNIYSSTIDGKNIQRHTEHVDFYVRNASTDGQRIVYHAGGDIFMLNVLTNKLRKIEIQYHSPRVQTQRKYVNAGAYLEDYAISPKADRVLITSRGQVFSFPNWQGSIRKHGNKPKARYRLGRWLSKNSGFVFVSDETGEDCLHVQTSDSHRTRTLKLDIGRPVELEASPAGNVVALSNHRSELMIVNLKTGRLTVLDRSKIRRISDIAWAPDGRWLAYAYYANNYFASCIKVADIATGKTYAVTRVVAQDFSPSFDPDGKYLYFLSNRHFDPVYDKFHFDLGFPANTKAYAILLRKDVPSPFEYAKSAPTGIDPNIPDVKKKTKAKPGKTTIDFKGITERILPFPLGHGVYTQIRGVKDKVLYAAFPVLGGKEQWGFDGPKPVGQLNYYDLNEQKSYPVASGILDFKTASDNDIIIYRTKDQLRIVKAMEKIDQKLPAQPIGPKSGWIDLGRVKILVEPVIEWQQMYRDVWRLQRDHFWTKNMSGVDWKKVYARYRPLLARINTRNEFSDLIWEMQGELGTSHAYEWGGDYRPQPPYRQGFLGADLEYVKANDAWRIRRIVRGDPWEKNAHSPLLAPGVNIEHGDYLVAINDIPVNAKRSPAELLINHADTEVSLTVRTGQGKKTRTITVRTIADESLARYRDWVESNRERVHYLSKNQIGYLHIPDMMPFGFAEFIRYYMAEFSYRGLIVDARFNGGGHTSELVLSYLTKKRIGYAISRWGNPEPYPSESVFGPMVALTNEHAGSDGDIFSHSFKLFKLGPLIGKRTWGGVVGISPYYNLADGGLTTQPEYSFWFSDVGWAVENYGTDPDIEVDVKPEEYARDKDPQLAAGIRECLRLINLHKPRLPEFGKRPLRSLPKGLTGKT